MNLVLYYIPDMNYFIRIVNQCSGHVFLELKDKSYLNLKDNGEGRFFLESIGQYVNGLQVLAEKKEDAILLLKALAAA